MKHIITSKSGGLTFLSRVNFRLLAFCIAILASGLTIFDFYQARSPQEMISALAFAPMVFALAFAPMALFFGLVTFRKQYLFGDAGPPIVTHPQLNRSTFPKHSTIAVEEVAVPKQEEGVADVDKRTLIKVLGSTGLSLLFYALFKKNFKMANLRSAFGQEEITLTDLAAIRKSRLTDGYHISEIDSDIISYYGFTNENNAWYIMRDDSDAGSFRYARGDGGFDNSWINRKQLKYDHFGSVFKEED